MQRKLIVLRHAKSDWGSGARTDHARPLNQRGRRDAPRIAAEICKRDWQPQAVISSDSTRTRETYALMSGEFADSNMGEPVVHFTSTLYHAGPYALEEALLQVTDSNMRVMAIGHNPGWEEVVNWLSGEVVRLTTANAALLHVDAPSWRDAIDAAGGWTLEDVIRPKEL